MEKGGKGFSLPPKSSLKSTQANNGNEESSPRPKGQRKVQFDKEGSHEQGFEFASKSNGKSGASAEKGGKVKGKAAKSKDVLPLELMIEKELPNFAFTCVMDCEAAKTLQGIQDQMILLSQDPSIPLPPSFDKGAWQAQRNARALYNDLKSARRVLETLKQHGVLEEEISAIANLYPESAEVAFAVVPSLKSKRSSLTEPLEVALKELAKLRKSDDPRDLNGDDAAFDV
ncbi:DNA-directed RNA polymerases IV and V subunit 4 [Linum grandiflorum]